MPDTTTELIEIESIKMLKDASTVHHGHYHESYRKENGTWRISKIRLTRLPLLMNGEEQAT